MKPYNVSDQTVGSVMQALHHEIATALNALTVDQVRDVVAFALAEHEHDEAEMKRFLLRYARQSYQEACRAFRQYHYASVPDDLYHHLWDVRDAVLEMILPDTLQYHPLTQALHLRRQDAVDGYFSSEYEQSQGW